MRRLCLLLPAVLLASTLVTGCGGGVDVGITVTPPPDADFDVGATLDGHRLHDVDVYPDEEQTIQVQTGDTLDLDSSGPVYWEIVAGSSGGIQTQPGGSVLYQGVAFTETVSNSGHLVLAISSQQPLLAPVPVTVYATSLYHADQTARIDLVVTR